MSGAFHARLRGRRGPLMLDVELEAQPASVTLLTGASGAGKTTLLRAFAGLERLTGEVGLGDELWQSGRRFVPPHRRGVGLVFQHDALFPHLDVAANLRYGASRVGGGESDLESVAALLGVGPLMSRFPDRLSGGERRRVALSRALSMQPRLLLLDEPLSGLDPVAKAELLAPLRQWLTRVSVPVILVSHDPADAAGLADRRLHLQEGRIMPEMGVDRVGAAP